MIEDVFLTWLYLQLFSREQSIRAWSKTWWGQEAKLSMPSPKQKANPDFQKRETRKAFTVCIEVNYRDKR